MAYIFLDESGDLGFNFTKKKTSKFFVITCLFVENKGPVEKVVKKIFQSFSKNELKKHTGTLHCFKEKPKTRLKLLGLLKDRECSIITIYLNKRNVYTRLKEAKHALYNYVTNILLDRIYTKKLIPLDSAIFLVASKRETNKFLNDNFSSYLKNQVLENHKIDIDITIRRPHEEKCLQVVDFVCWSVFRKIEMGDESYYSQISSKIVEENPLFP